jgi:hypothetical protein
MVLLPAENGDLKSGLKSVYASLRGGRRGLLFLVFLNVHELSSTWLRRVWHSALHFMKATFRSLTRHHNRKLNACRK